MFYLSFVYGCQTLHLLMIYPILEDHRFPLLPHCEKDIVVVFKSFLKDKIFFSL